jgi:hypothetical protein
MVTIKKSIASYLVSFFIISILLVPAMSWAQAPTPGACPPGGSTGATAVCNPAPNFFVNLMNLGPNSQPNTFQGIFLFIIQSLLGVVGLIAVIFIIWGGVQYITSRGNEEQAETGKRTLTDAIIGLVIVILSYVIVVVVINALRYGVT